MRPITAGDENGATEGIAPYGMGKENETKRAAKCETIRHSEPVRRLAWESVLLKLGKADCHTILRDGSQ